MLSLVVSITYLLCIVAEQLVQRRGTADDRRLLVAVRACIDPRCAGEVTESCGDLRAVLRVEDAHTVVLLAEEVARHAHRLMDAPERPVPAAGAARDLGALDVDAAESFRFVHGICRIVRLACCEDCFDSELIINAIVRADAQTLPESVPRAVSVVACRICIRLRFLRLAHLRAVVAAIGARPHTVVAEEVEAALCPAVRCRLGAAQEEVVSVEVFQRHAIPVDQYAVRVAVNARVKERAELIELHIHAEAEHAVVIGTVIVLMVKEIVDSCIDGEVLADILLDEEVPDAEALFTVFAALADVVARAVLFKQIVRLDRVAVEHAAEEAAPERRAPAVRLILVVDADIEFMRRAVEQTARQIIVARIDRVQVGIAELCAPVLVKLVLNLCLNPRELCLADVAEAVDAVGHVAEAPPMEVEVHELTCEVVGHIV